MYASGLIALAVALASSESAFAWFRVACTGPLVSGMFCVFDLSGR